MFGLANQLLSVIALCLATTLLIKMGKTRYVAVTVAPLIFMCGVTFSAGWLKIFSADPKLGFLSGAEAWLSKAPGLIGTEKLAVVRQAAIWRVDAVVAAAFLLLVFLIVAGSVLQWWVGFLHGRREVVLRESEFVPLASLEIS